MAELTIQQAFVLAVRHHKAGHMHEAEQLLRQISQRQPEHAEVFRLLGVIAHQLGQNETALNLVRRAIAIRPNYAEAHYNLSTVLGSMRQYDDAIAACRQAISFKPDHADAYNNLGVALKNQGRLDEATDAYRQAIAIVPTFAEAHSNLGNALREQGRLDEAIAAYRQAIASQPGYALAHNNLGVALRDKGQLSEAIAACRQAIALNPNFPQAYSNLGNALRDNGQFDEAVVSHLRALEIDPNFADSYNNLGIALKDHGPLDEAIAAFGKAVALKPDHAEAYNNLGNALKETGRIDQAVAAFRRAIAINPSFSDAHSNLLYALHCHADYDALAVAEEHRRWNRQHAEPLGIFIKAHANERDPERRLRIGYVSPDFCNHVVGRFFMPLLERHDRSAFEIFCYSNVRVPDATTERMRGRADFWRNIVGVCDAEAADAMREDKIDILVDLAGHTAGNRLRVLARKPAPVQASCLGYPATTGVTAIDYRLTDALSDPPGLTETHCTEQLVRLTKTAWCFEPPPHAPPVGALPAIARQCVTFGSFNNFAKVTEPMLKCWAQILRNVPNSRLLLKAKAMNSPSVKNRVWRIMRDAGIGADRLDLRELVRAEDHLATYGQADMALDTYPYHGTTTTCESLWMGAPVVTLAGESHVSRVGASLLTNVGLAEMIASTMEEYVRIATALANDLPRLSQIRASLRQRMSESPLTDAPNFARDVEAAYRQMWRTWCETVPAVS